MIKINSSLFLRFVALNLFGLVVLSLCFIQPQPLRAGVAYGGIELEPTLPGEPLRHYYAFTLAEGEEVTDYFYIANKADETKTIMLYGGYWVVNSDGELEHPEQPIDYPANTGDWITFSKNKVTLSPGRQEKISFTMKVPQDADVGDFQGEIYAQELISEAKKQGSGLQLYTRVGVSVYNTVPGEIKRDLQIKRITHRIEQDIDRKLVFKIFFENHGNVKLIPKIDIKMRGLFGSVGEQTDIVYGPIARDQKIALEGDWIRRAPYFGRFVADFTFKLPAREQLNKDRTKTMLPEITIQKRYVFWILPWAEIMYVLVLLFIAYLLRSLWLYYLILNRLKTKTSVYTVVTGDTLTKISAKLGADPRVLAKFNLLKWPYEVKPGDKLLIPTGRLQPMEWRERLQSVLGHRAIFTKAFGHFFGRRNTHEISKRMQGIISTDKNLAAEVVIVERGDTIEDVADFARTTTEAIIKLNHLRPPYRLRTGQELLIPKAKSAKSVKKSTKRKPKR